MLVEIPKMSRRLSLLTFDIQRHTGNKTVNGQHISINWSRIEFTFSNTSRRPIKPIKCGATTYSGLKPSGEYLYGHDIDEILEGHHRSGQINYSDDWLQDNDLKTIYILDTMKKTHIFYFYKGKERNKWIWYLLYYTHVWR